jgi:hypothetical protein
VLKIELPRPRDFVMQDSGEFRAYSGRVRELFLQHGVLRGR